VTSESKPDAFPQLLSRAYEEQHSEIAFIAGGKVYRLARQRLGTITDMLVKETPFGCSMPILFMEHQGRRFYVLPRHGEGQYRVSAPFVNYRANVWALKELGVRRIIAWTGPGSLTPKLEIGEFVLPGDLLDMTRNRSCTFFENKGIGLLRQKPVFCPTLEKASESVLGEYGTPVASGAVYAVSEGPRLETPAEVKMLRQLGAELVGMTLAPEAFLARELEICYHPIAYVTAFAEGVAEVDDTERRKRSDEAVNRIPEITWSLLDAIPDTPFACSCQDAMLRYKQRGIIGDDFQEWIE
jgi:5'-methylthioadenosine phosphorylase